MVKKMEVIGRWMKKTKTEEKIRKRKRLKRQEAKKLLMVWQVMQKVLLKVIITFLAV
ncbi:hypothetical protein FACS189472_14920 [Alphaproteobacteria bacterium]|nr:hypothetical protein FACS189472_14920 [Alphaproteobacteria bacterium]